MFLKKKVFIITGASSGIGEELSKQLSGAGSLVVCAARRLDELERVCGIINDAGGKSIPIQTDITVLSQCQNMVDQTIKTFGRVDGLILNAGISMWARFDEISDIGFFQDLLNVNYLGAVNCVHAALPHLKKSRGKIVSCSTGQALMGFPRHSGYAASKHALHGFLSTLAIENKKDLIWVDLNILPKSGKSLGGHIVSLNEDTPDGFTTSCNPNVLIQLNNTNFKDKFPFSTLIFLLWIYNKKIDFKSFP